MKNPMKANVKRIFANRNKDDILSVNIKVVGHVNLNNEDEVKDLQEFIPVLTPITDKTSGVSSQAFDYDAYAFPMEIKHPSEVEYKPETLKTGKVIGEGDAAVGFLQPRIAAIYGTQEEWANLEPLVYAAHYQKYFIKHDDLGDSRIRIALRLDRSESIKRVKVKRELPPEDGHIASLHHSEFVSTYERGEYAYYVTNYLPYNPNGTVYRIAKNNE